MSDMAHYTPDAALAVAVSDPVTANPPLPGAEAVADILRDMRAKERELWTGEPPRMGCAAVALMLDAYIDRLAVAIGELPPPKGRAPVGGELVELGRQKLAALFEAARLRDLVRRLAQREANLRADSLREEVDKLNDVAASLQRSRDASLADADRLRDLVRRLAQGLQMARLEGFGGPEREKLLDEAREAAGEAAP